MTIKKSDYEALLAEYCSSLGAIALLKQYRSYFEMLPSIRRPEQSLIAIPLPIVRIRRSDLQLDPLKPTIRTEATRLPCDLVILTCDPQWQIKLDTEILIFIHRPEEDFSDLIDRWRQTQVCLDRDYEWLMPSDKQHMFSEAAGQIRPLFVIFEATSDRIKQGLSGASFPFIVNSLVTNEVSEITSECGDR